MKKPIFLFFVILLQFLFLFSCKKSTEPITNNTGPDTTSHEYNWKVDTLQGYPDAMQVLISDIWGTDENNVWAVGHSDDVDYQIWRWDGANWISFFPEITGQRHSPSFSAIYGFSENDFWIVGAGLYYKDDTSNELNSIDYILRYNSGEWKRIREINAPACYSIWGTSSNNLYIGCDSGIVIHKDQNVWTRQQTPHKSQIIKISGVSEQEVYATGVLLYFVTGVLNYKYYLYKYYNENWMTIDSIDTSLPKDQWPFGQVIWGMDNGYLYSAGGNGIYVYSNNIWVKLLGGHPFGAVYGNSPNNIFAAALFGVLYHYNGNTWKKDEFFDKYYFDAIGDIWCNENYVFLAVENLYISYIFRGEKRVLERR
ncbi:MAG: hypothetical protein JXR46_09830 [Calditrichaceae bacterium]|nr:hypothetical protein [Calditrichaceae bacterium]MBN2709333.1 hypothetical protein [Calditrichaceae bacterium]RQV94666.1 MAG: hypothetical protein EH224_09610 [Calditrichota bacterium]